MKVRIKVNLVFFIALITLLCNSCDYFDKLSYYEKAWDEQNLLFFQKKVENFKNNNIKVVFDENILFTDISNVYYIDKEFFDRVSYKNEYEKFIIINSSFFWEEYFKSNRVFKKCKLLDLSNFFIYDRLYTSDEKNAIKNALEGCE